MKISALITLQFLLLQVFCSPVAWAHLSFFWPSKASDVQVEAASSNSAVTVAPPSYTSILFGTSVTKPGTEAAGEGGQQPASGSNQAHDAQGDVKGQSDHHTATSLPQSYSAGMPLHNTNLPSNLATNAPRMPPRYPSNAQPHLNPSMLDLKGMEGKTKTGSFSWMSPQGEVYDVSYVADVRPPPATTSGSFKASPPVRPQQSHYSYSPLRPRTA